MRKTLNECVFEGRTTKDIEVKDGGNWKLAKFSLAIPGGKDGKRTDYANMDIWGDEAEQLAKEAPKGTLLKIKCKYTSGSYTKGGNKVYTYGFTVKSYEVLETPKHDSESNSQNSYSETSQVTKATEATAVDDFISVMDDDDLPFK